MRVIVETNVVLDVLLARQPFVTSAASVFGLIEQSRIEGLLCATTVTTIDYLLGRSLPRSEGRALLSHLLELFEVAPVNRAVIEEAFRSRLTDFEDAILEQSGRLAGADILVTRNLRDFHGSAIKALDPDELLSSGIGRSADE